MQSESRGGEISRLQIEQASGTIVATAISEGVEVLPDTSEVPRIGFSEIIIKLELSGIAPKPEWQKGVIKLDRSDLVGRNLDITGARCVISVERGGSKAMFPAVALGPNKTGLRFAALANLKDRRNPANPDSKLQILEPLQQQLLDVALVHSGKDVGQIHGSGGSVNVGEVGHGAFVSSVSDTNINIHSLTHLAGSAGAVSAVISPKMKIYAKNTTPRPTDVSVLSVSGIDNNASTISEVYIVKGSQIEMPPAITAFQIGAGLVRAAMATGEAIGADVPRVDLVGNLGRIILPLTSGNQVSNHAH